MQVARASSFSCSGLDSDDQLERRLKGQIEGIGASPRLFAERHDGETLIDKTWPAAEVGTLPAALEKLIDFLRGEIGGALPAAIGHRVVHGGPIQ